MVCVQYFLVYCILQLESKCWAKLETINTWSLVVDAKVQVTAQLNGWKTTESLRKDVVFYRLDLILMTATHEFLQY